MRFLRANWGLPPQLFYRRICAGLEFKKTEMSPSGTVAYGSKARGSYPFIEIMIRQNPRTLHAIVRHQFVTTRRS